MDNIYENFMQVNPQVCKYLHILKIPDLHLLAPISHGWLRLTG